MAKKILRKKEAPVSKGQYVFPQLVVKSPTRKVYDVGAWRTAMQAADTGRVKQLYDLLDDIVIDGVLGDAIQKRIDAVTNAELTFQDADGESVDLVNELMDSPAWEDLLTGIIQRKFLGRSGLEMNFSGEFQVDAIPAKHIDLRGKTILINDADQSGVPYEGVPELLILGKERDYGLLLKAAPYAIYKRGGFGDWSQWIELFGMPQRIGKYNTYDPQSRMLLEEAFEKAGSAPYVVIPKEADVETKEVSSGSGSSYNEFRQACNEEMLITILGQTLTTVSGENGARSLGEVHKGVEEGKNKSDLRFVQRVLNRFVLPVLQARGYPVEGGKFIFPKSAEALSVADVVSLSDIISIPQSFLHEKYSIPEPKDGEPVARRAAMSFPPDPEQGDPLPDDDPSGMNHADRNLFIRLWDFFVGAPRDGASNGRAPIALSDNAALNERVAAGVWNGDTGAFDPELFEHISSDLLNAVSLAYKRSMNQADIRYDYGIQDDAFITAMEMNLYHFSAGKTLAEIQALNKAFRDSKNYGDFAKKAAGITDTFNNQWQKTEYETAVLAAESASNYHRLVGKNNLFPFWKYVTAGDDKVREEHRALDGVILPANDPLWNKIFPPNGWKCRCRVVPLMRHEASGVDIDAMRLRVNEYFGSKEWKMNAAQGWDSNRGESAEIFTKNQQYINKFPNKSSKNIDALFANDYGLDSFGKKVAAAKDQVPLFTGDAKAWFDAHKVLEDYKGRKLQLSEQVFEKHTTGKYEATRVPLLACISDALKQPDEVWINDYKKSFTNVNVIKFYEGKAFVVVCKVDEGKVYQVTTWFDVAMQAKTKEGGKGSRMIDPKWRYRRGLLIKK